MVEELRGLFARAGSPGEIELYPTVHHGFAFPQRWCYDKPAAERHWERLIALLGVGLADPTMQPAAVHDDHRRPGVARHHGRAE